MRWRWKSIHRHVSRVTKAATWKKVRLKTTPISSGKQHGRLPPTQNSVCQRTTPLAHTNLETRIWIHTNRVFQVFLRPKTKTTNKQKQANKTNKEKQQNLSCTRDICDIRQKHHGLALLRCFHKPGHMKSSEKSLQWDRVKTYKSTKERNHHSGAQYIKHMRKFEAHAWPWDTRIIGVKGKISKWLKRWI